MKTPCFFPKIQRVACAAAAFAAALPSLLAYNVAPSPTFLNQALAFGLWAAFVVVSEPALRLRGAAPLLAALGVLALAAAWSWGPGSLPAGLALSAIGSLAAAAVLVAGGAGARARGAAVDLFAAFCWAWVAAGVLNVIVALLQVFAPEWCDGDWIAASGNPGRAVGNLRQPNHLSSLLLWSCIAAAALLQLGRLGRHGARWAAALLVAFVFAVVLTASRTGLVSVLLLALWGLLDRRLSRRTRALLMAAPLAYLLSWLLMAQWAALSQHRFGGSERLAETDISSSRFAIWRDTLGLIAAQPWAGVGFGEFNVAWTLTPFPHRPVAFFDHTHNLPLQLAVELGLPLAALVLGLLLWALCRAARNAWLADRESGSDIGTAQRSALLMVLMIGLHSLLEYPLWYSYFLLPAAWAFGFALQGSDAVKRLDKPAPVLAWAALVVLFGTALSVLDYHRVTLIFSAEPGVGPLERRIAAGQRSVLFAHHADYAAVTSGEAAAQPPHAFDRATHYLLDTRLMIAWAQSLAAQGRLDEARHIAARLREFGKEDAGDFFAPCAAPLGGATLGVDSANSANSANGTSSASSASTAIGANNASGAGAANTTPFQCALPARAPGWREFVAGGK